MASTKRRRIYQAKETVLRPPLRWAGSKRGILPMLLSARPPEIRRYVEPFAGSACFFFALNPSLATISDLNASLIQFYSALRNNHTAILRALNEYDQTGRDYYEVRAIDEKLGSPYQRAARFLYLNRFSFNGVYRTNAEGKYNVPRGSRTGGLPSAGLLAAAAARLRGRKLVNGDFEEVLSECESGDFVYLDPPYFTRPNVTLGEYGYGAMGKSGDLNRLANALLDLDSRGVHWLLSYSNSRRLIDYLRPKWKMRIEVRRNVGGNAASRFFATELLLANYKPAHSTTAPHENLGS